MTQDPKDTNTADPTPQPTQTQTTKPADGGSSFQTFSEDGEQTEKRNTNKADD